ncbi:MAG TPA: CAP domain-containing protein [Crocinitomicaceae bacterium]|nr:CAP domain-containing protein [Crocinitomicaceae bacterium]
MKKILSTLIVLLIVFSASASDLFYNRLEKLYKKDKKKCLTVAKRYIDYLPNQSASYYFAAIVYKYKAENARNSRGEYLHLRKAIGYAVQFEELKDEELQNKVQWLHVKGELNEDAVALISVLSENNEFAFSERLKTRLSEMNHEFYEEEIALNLEVEKNEIVDVFNSSNTTKMFFGMPNGNEIVQSASVSGEQELLGYINAERKKKGLVPLEWEEDMAKASRYHAYDLGTQNYFNHSTYDRKNGKLVKVGGTFDRIKKFYTKSFVNGENIAAGNESPYLTYQQWFNSPGHYEIMFNPESTKIGIGVFSVEDSPFGYYWSMCTAK